MEDLDFRCQWNDNDRYIIFHWRDLTGTGYQNLSLSIYNENNHLVWMISCDPYLSQGVCSTKHFPLEPGEVYLIIAKLKKILPNYHGQKNETCTIRTSLTPISIESIQHQFLNESALRLHWLNNRLHIQCRLRNLETNGLIDPVDTNYNQSAIFNNLAEGNIYRVEFNISKASSSPLLQITPYRLPIGSSNDLSRGTKFEFDYFFFDEDLRATSIDRVVRISDHSLLIHVNRSRLTTIKILFCWEEVLNNTVRSCSASNKIQQLRPGTIYRIAVITYRDPFEKRFIWSNKTTLKLVNTSKNIVSLSPNL